MSFHEGGGGGGNLIRWSYHRVITEQEICAKLPFNISFSTERLTLEICMYKTAFMPHIPPQKNKLNQYEYVVSSVRKRNTKKHDAVKHDYVKIKHDAYILNQEYLF